MARHGGGAFSGKDPTKVDRSAAYAVRHVAKNVVAAGIATRCEVQVAYAIGVAHPVSVMVETFGTSQIDPNKLGGLVHDIFDLRPAAIIERLDLRRPIYRRPRPTGTSVAATATSRGSAPTTPTSSRRRRRRSPDAECARVQPDVPAIHRAFDYSVPDAFVIEVGTIVRVPLHGRRVRGWVVDADVAVPDDGVRLRDVLGVVSAGPPADVVDLCRWAAWRWAGPAGHVPARRRHPPTSSARGPNPSRRPRCTRARR